MKAAIIPGKRPLPELLPIDDLDRAIVTLSARINAEWLHYRCDCRSGP